MPEVTQEARQIYEHCIYTATVACLGSSELAATLVA